MPQTEFEQAFKEMTDRQTEWDMTPRFERTDQQWYAIIRAQSKVDKITIDTQKERDARATDQSGEAQTQNG